MSVPLHPNALHALLTGNHGAPFDVLGPHTQEEGSTLLRAFRPHAASLTAVHSDGRKIALQRVYDEGVYEATVEGEWTAGQYHYEEVTYNGHELTFADPYAFPSQLTDFDIYLLREGKHLYSYEKLGAHVREIDGISGVSFVVWAPNARRVSVVGNFNGWDARLHPMRLLGESGLWELFIPDLNAGEVYRYDLLSHHHGYHAMKTDPYGFFAEVRPANASVVYDINQYQWADETWMTERKSRKNLTAPMSILEVHLGSWRRGAANEFLTYRQLADELVTYVRDMGYTHIELLPVTEHPLDASWGYQVTGYYAPTSRFGTPDDFMVLVDKCHQNGIGVLLDWVPAHFPKDGHALSYFDGTHLYSHEDARRGEQLDWGTYVFNYGRNEVRNFLISNALFWLKHYHLDGLRVDAVSSMLYLDFSRPADGWLPNKYGGRENIDAIEFMRELNTVIHAEAPGTVMIAEESTSWPMVSRPTYVGGLGFTFKWDMGWMHDTLKYVQKDPIHRRYHHNQVTFSMFYAFSENFILSLSHDEVVHGKGSLINKIPGDWWQKFATLRLLFGYQHTHSGKKLNFMGQEFGQWREWSEARALDWNLLELPTHQGMQRWTRDLNHFYKAQPALWERDLDWEGFQWIEANDADNSTFSYMRFAQDRGDFVVVVCNFTPVPIYHYHLGVPEAGYYKELLNSDSAHYGGGDVGNNGGVQSKAQQWREWANTLEITVPPLGMVVFKLERPQAAT
jgi:1,4-alpha-glucan branching enzyme